MSNERFVVEGTWSGYRSSQRRVCHRTVHTKDREKFEALRNIAYTDGTFLELTVRSAKPREKVEAIHGYDDLITKCIKHGVRSVRKLAEIEGEIEAQIKDAPLIIRVGVFEHQGKRVMKYSAYTVWFSGDWDGCCVHYVKVSKRRDAKPAAIAEHKANCASWSK